MEYPYFPLYVKDFIIGTIGMSSEEVGGYVKLLLHEWDKGSIPTENSELLKISGVKNKSLETIKKKFKDNGCGGLINGRLEFERSVISKKYMKLQENGAKGGRPAKAAKKANENQMVLDDKPNGFETETKTKPNGGENKNQNKNKNQTNTSVLEAPAENFGRPEHAPSMDKVREIFHQLGRPEQAQGFFDYYEALGWMAGITKIVNPAPFANRWVSNPVAQKQQQQAAGRKVIMEHMGSEVVWTEEQYLQYCNNENATGYFFVRYEQL